MEGYLLVFTKECSAKVQFCVLEHGMLHCFDKPGGMLHESIGLTRHRIRVQPLYTDNAGVCPNRFAVHTLEVKRNDQAGAFVAAGKCEKSYYFAAVTSKSMMKWANAIYNWRRHGFDDPTSSALSVLDAITNKAMKTPIAKRRSVLLETQRINLVNLANRFDVRLVTMSSNATKKTCGVFKRPLLCVTSRYTDANIIAARSSFTVISWLPGLPGR